MSDSSSKPGESISFHTEIGLMMHGLGDSSNPNPQTVALVESIVLNQLRQIVIKARMFADSRGQSQIAPEHIIYLMRHNKSKLRRMLAYMKSLYNFNFGKFSGETFLNGVYKEEKWRKLFYEPASIYLDRYMADGDDEFYDYKDPVIIDRRQRAANLADSLPIEKYFAFQSARRIKIGLAKGKMSALEKWLFPKEDIDISSPASMLISYLCKETIAQIVDLAFYVRRDMKSLRNDPFARFRGGNCCNPVTLGDSQIAKTGHEGITPISVSEVREVVRRYTTPRIGTVGLFYRNIKSDPPLRLFAI